MNTRLIIFVATSIMTLTACTQTQTTTNSTAGPAPANLSADELNRRRVEGRAIEAVIWGMPAVNYERMLQAAIANGAQLNQIVYWSRPVNEKNQTLTPNPDTI